MVDAPGYVFTKDNDIYVAVWATLKLHFIEHLDMTRDKSLIQPCASAKSL
jgi:hypothetical protein